MRETLRMRAVQSPVIPIVGELIRDHPGTISLGQGVVGYPPPPQAARQIDRFLGDPENHKYALVDGLPRLRELVAGKLERDNRVSVTDRNRVVVTAGGNMAFFNAVLAVTDPGDEVILLTPYYFNHDMAITMAGCRTVAVATGDDYLPVVERIAGAITPRSRAVVTISPNNPTGAVYPPESLRQVNALCADRGLYHIHDEAYEYFTYEDVRHFSPASDPEVENHTLSLFSLSKSYGLASWRIGYMVIPSHLFQSVAKIQDTILICPPVISQMAAIGALEVGSAYPRGKLAELDQVRRLLLDRLGELTPICRVPRADGAFYVFLSLATDLDPMLVVERLIREHRVAAVPGSTFGASGCHLRVSYGALDRATLEEGMNRLVVGLRAIVRCP